VAVNFVGEVLIPNLKHDLIATAEEEVKEIEQQYTSGLVTVGERYNKVVDIWGRAGDQVGKAMMEQLSHEEVPIAWQYPFARSNSTPST
jgi:DNA-directed RNA polymerase subunit beta'